MKHRVVRMEITLRELAEGWLWSERGRTYRTAVGAVRAFRREAKAIVKADPKAAVLQLVTWVPCTSVGLAVAKALTDQADARREQSHCSQ